MNEPRVRKSYLSLTDQDRDRILELYESGLSTTEIVNYVPFSRSSICYVIQAYRAVMNHDTALIKVCVQYSQQNILWASHKVLEDGRTPIRRFTVSPRHNKPINEFNNEPVVNEPYSNLEQDVYEIKLLLSEILKLLR